MKLDDLSKLKIKVYTTIAFIVIAFYFAILRIDSLRAFISDVTELLSPFIIGVVIAFLLDKPMMLCEKYLLKVNINKKLARTISTVVALAFGILVVIGFCMLIVPQLLDSIISLLEQAPGMIEKVYYDVELFLVKNHISTDVINKYLGDDFLSRTLATITTTITQTIPQILALGGKVTDIVLNTLLGLIAGVYIMLEKELFMRGAKKCTYAFLKTSTADYLTRFAGITRRVFNDFILGKALDSLIIGILLYFIMNLLNMPYSLLLSTIVGVTNMIPVFGPFIGAIPGVFILMVMEFKLGIYFALLILAIQQFDGNILGPMILGDRLGLPSLAILFSVTVGGGLFGIVGMFIGVPTFAVIYIAVKEVVDERLKQKQIEI